MANQTQNIKNKNEMDSLIQEFEDLDIKKAKETSQLDKIDEYIQQMCPECNVEMDKYTDEHSEVCPKCGMIINTGNCGEYNINTGEGHSTSSNAYMPLKPIGARHKLYYHTMVKCTSENETFSQANIYKTFEHINYINNDLHIPKNVIRAAADLFIVLRKNKFVKRSDSRKGLIGACIGKECERAKITKTDAQLAKMVGVSETNISTGRKELQNFHNEKIIDIPQNQDPIPDLINAHFEDFRINEKYKKFVLELLQRIQKKKIDEIETAYATTKCIGAIYTLSSLVDLGITHEQIAAKCGNISRGTYINIYNAIIKNEKKLRKVFVRNSIPTPSSWKQTPNQD